MLNKKYKKAKIELGKTEKELKFWRDVASGSLVELFNLTQPLTGSGNIKSIQRMGESIEYEFISGVSYKFQIEKACECCGEKMRNGSDKVNHTKLLNIYETPK